MKRTFAVTALSLGVLVGCAASSPPGKELAEEMIDTLDVSDQVKECMIGQVEDFGLTEEEALGFSDFDDVAAKAASGNEQAQLIMARFEADLAACN